ncbi:unnamed protein product [Closterium sp. Naga37s-1]|nr:unnamed protein product [Closterium sp. Naga37s-1]
MLHPSSPASNPLSCPTPCLSLSSSLTPHPSSPIPKSPIPHPSTTPNQDKTGGRSPFSPPFPQSPFPHLLPPVLILQSTGRQANLCTTGGRQLQKTYPFPTFSHLSPPFPTFPHLSPPFPPFPPHLSPPPQSSSFNRSPGQSVHNRGKTAGSGGASRVAAAAAPETWLPESALTSGAPTVSPTSAGAPNRPSCIGSEGIGSAAGVWLGAAGDGAVGWGGRGEETDRELREEDSVPLLPKRLHFDQLSAPTPGVASFPASAATESEKPLRRRRCRACMAAWDMLVLTVVILLISFIIVGGILTTFPIICPLHPPFSHHYPPPPPRLLPVPLPFLLHALITLLLSLQTVFNFLCSALLPAGPVTRVAFGSADMPTVSAGSFDGWQLCRRCDPPRAKPPGAHHCSSCGTCVMDMDHHCPFVST